LRSIRRWSLTANGNRARAQGSPLAFCNRAKESATAQVSPQRAGPAGERCLPLLHSSSAPEALSAAYGHRPAFWPQGQFSRDDTTLKPSCRTPLPSPRSRPHPTGRRRLRIGGLRRAYRLGGRPASGGPPSQCGAGLGAVTMMPSDCSPGVAAAAMSHRLGARGAR